MYHKSVLIQEVLENLHVKPGGIYIDVTFGGGGHTRAILEQESTCQVIAFDWDMVAIEKNGEPLMHEFPGRLILLWANFAQIDRMLKKEGLGPVDGILADFGTSQFQLQERAGFSFNKDTKLDMRMSPPHQKITAYEVINKAGEDKLCEIFKELGQESRAKQIAHAIVQERYKNHITTTGQLAALIERAVPRYGKLHPVTKVFQALRMYVNKELENIRSFLPGALNNLKPGGRLVCITFHSLEDRLVKQFFNAHQQELDILTRHVVIASEVELQENPSARSAKLRAAEFKGAEVVVK